MNQKGQTGILAMMKTFHSQMTDNFHDKRCMKQLDRELPWREIMEMPAAAKDQFAQSATKEYNGWMKWTGIKPISEHEAKKIYASPQVRKRIMKSRGAYKDKSKGTGPLQAKTRVVIIGCQDPDLRQLTRDSPTPTRLSEYLILSIAASGANMLFNVDGKKWYLCLSDAAQAFLQGSQDPSERNGPYLKPEHSLPCSMRSPATAMGLPMHRGCGSTRSKPSCSEPTSSSTASIAACFITSARMMAPWVPC